MKIIRHFFVISAALTWGTQAADVPLSKDDASIAGWATGYVNYQPGSYISENWKTPEQALGPAEGTADDIVCLGRGGQITMTFSPPVQNGSGNDFAVFENGVSSTFLELGWVEVSSDGTHFVRFPNSSLTEEPVGSFGEVDPNGITGLASKYMQGLGTQFDLNQLQVFYDNRSFFAFSSAFRSQLVSNFPYLELNNIQYIRIIDIVGDGTAKDAYGRTIYDPYPTAGSAGFDLDAIAVLNQQGVDGAAQTITFPDIPNQKLSTGFIELTASSDSGLPVSFSLIEGPATLAAGILTFTNSGRVVVEAAQDGDATYAPAVPVWQGFHVAEKLQHIWVEPIPNQVAGAASWQIQAAASSGLPVYAEITGGPTNTLIDTNTLLLSVGDDTGSVCIRAAQSGDDTYAPAEDLIMQFDIVSAGDSAAPQTFAEWSAGLGLSADAQLDTDGDGASNLQEFMAASDPQNPHEVPLLVIRASTNPYGKSQMKFTFSVNRQAPGRTQFQAADSLTQAWINAVPEIVASESVSTNGQAATVLTVQMPAEENRTFYRLLFEEVSE